ncbi:MAG: HD domain-containing protein [Spirochaetales bacterium]|nr:HD domain-containing protein [Spirochaetales bacterium]
MVAPRDHYNPFHAESARSAHEVVAPRDHYNPFHAESARSAHEGVAPRDHYNPFLSENGKPARAGFPYDCPGEAEAKQLEDLHIRIAGEAAPRRPVERLAGRTCAPTGARRYWPAMSPTIRLFALLTAMLAAAPSGPGPLHAQEPAVGTLAALLDEARLALSAELDAEARRDQTRADEAANFRVEEARLLAELERLPEGAKAPARALLAELRSVEARRIEERERGRVASRERTAELEALTVSLAERIARGEDVAPAASPSGSPGVLAWIAVMLGIAGLAAGLVALRKHNIGTERRADTAEALSRPVAAAPESGETWDGASPAWDEGRTERDLALLDEDRRKILSSLLDDCARRGEQIDAATRRPGSSYLVAALAHAIAAELGLDPEERLLHRCAGLVYDSGFLVTDPEVFELPRLSDAQFAEIRRHPEAGTRMLDFVPEPLRPLLAQAALCHHENLDGSGYPRALRGAKVPRVARIIRAAESFTALVSARPWRRTRDQETAIDELVHRPDVYDRVIVRALEAAVSGA